MPGDGGGGGGGGGGGSSSERHAPVRISRSAKYAFLSSVSHKSHREVRLQSFTYYVKHPLIWKMADFEYETISLGDELCLR
jgi:hypothetical protein